MATRITRKATSEIKFGYKVPVTELKEFFNLIPDTAEITVDHYAGDQRDPTETTITAEWPL
jgi:hypothetical protein